MEKLTTKQKETLQTLKKFIAKHGYPPTVRELCKELDLNSPATIHFHLKKLAEKGYIKKASSKNRTIELLVNNEYADKRDNVIDVALLGNIAAVTLLKQLNNQMNSLKFLLDLLIQEKNYLLLMYMVSQ